MVKNKAPDAEKVQSPIPTERKSPDQISSSLWAWQTTSSSILPLLFPAGVKKAVGNKAVDQPGQPVCGCINSHEGAVANPLLDFIVFDFKIFRLDHFY